VTVATFGQSAEFPAFFTQSSGYPSPYNVSNVDEAASLLTSHSKLGIHSGMLLAVPIPNKYAEMGDSINKAINMALDESKSVFFM